MANLDPRIIVVALGAGALGGPDALLVLLDFAGRNPIVDIAICVCVMAMVTAQLLGAMLLARFIRKACPGAGAARGAPGAPAMDCFAKMTLVVSVGVAFLVTACLVVASGGLGSARLMFDVAGKSPAITVVVIGAAGSLPCIVLPLLRAFREVGAAEGAAPAARATERFAEAFRMVYYIIALPVAACILLVIAAGRLDALSVLPGFNNMFVGAATAAAAVVSTMLLSPFSRRARKAAAAAARAVATAAGGFGKLTQVTSLAIVSCALICLLVATYAQTQRVPECGMYPCPA